MNVNPAQTQPRIRFYKLAVAWAVISTSLLVALVVYGINGVVDGPHGPHSPHGPHPHKPHGPRPPCHDKPINQTEPVPKPSKRNVIFMVSDGMGPASVAMARNYFQHITHDNDTQLFLDDYFIGNSRTRSNSSFVTDSAAGATAFSCGLKSYNGAIGVDPFGQPCATVMEAAKLAGYLTGLVVTTRITDATPASFVTHAGFRTEEDWIAEQIVNYNDVHPFGRTVDLVFGGGQCHFYPAGHPDSCRSDDRDLFADAEEHGWNVIKTDSEFRDLDMGRNVSLPLLGLFTPHDFPFTIDYHDLEFPKLNETALTAVKALTEATKDSDKGFFLLVEGSRIDHCGHNNDAGAQVREVLAYNDAFKAMVEFAETSDVPTVVVSTSDHETGGLSLAKQVSKQYPVYQWFPEVLHHAQHSIEYLAAQLASFEGKKHDLTEFVKNFVLGEHGLGFTDFTHAEVQEIAHHLVTAQNRLAQMQSWRAEVGWATHGHSGVDVNVYGGSNYPELLQPILGANENIEIGSFLRDMLFIEQSTLDDLTKELRDKFGNKFDPKEPETVVDYADHYTEPVVDFLTEA